MTSAICYMCGAPKGTPLRQCDACGIEPRSVEAFSKSLVLSSHLMDEQDLADASARLKKGQGFPFPPQLLRQADEALKDKQLTDMLKLEAAEPQAGKKMKEKPSPSKSVNQAKTPSSLISTQSALHQSPFYLLGVSLRDSRKRIIEAADERSLEIGDEACQSARSQLTNPRQRITAEVAWLPGVSPSKSQQLMKTLEADAQSLRAATGLPSLAHLNLLSAAFEGVDSSFNGEQISEFICEIADLAESLDPAEVLRDLNEDRVISGFAEIRSVDQVEVELAERKRHYRNSVKEVLNRLPPDRLVEAMTLAVESATYSGEIHAPELIDDLVDGYEVDVQGFLEAEAANVERLLEAIRGAAGNGEGALKPLVDKLELVATNWDRVAQPIQVSAKARGIRHEASHDVAYDIRSVAIDLWNEHGHLALSQRLTALVQSLFAELPELSDRVEQDVEALRGIQQNREKDVQENAEWEREITFSAELGMIFKDVLSISPSGVSWKGRSYPLDKITRVRWGATVHRTNGIKTGTTYTFAFGDDTSEAVGTISKKEVFDTFIDKLWRSVCFRLLNDLVKALKAGRELSFGGGKIRDDGVTLIKHKMFGANEAVTCPWSNTQIYSANGAFYVQAKDDKKAYIGSSYIEGRNTHIFEQLIRMAYKKPGMRKLSDILN